jgi:hypothetical protein
MVNINLLVTLMCSFAEVDLGMQYWIQLCSQYVASHFAAHYATSITSVF